MRDLTPTSRGTRGSGQVRVHRFPPKRPDRDDPGVEDVPVVGGVNLGVLRLAQAPAVSDRRAPGSTGCTGPALLHGTYGYRRIHADLAAEGVACSPELVRQIMRQEHLVPCQPRPFRVTTQADAEAAACMPDLVKRDFTAERPGVKFVGDITYIHTWQGFIYLATVIDCYSKKVVGWSIADHMRTELVETTLRNAAATAVIEPDAIFHSDRGSVYTSAGYRALVAGLGMRSSMGRTGVCWDNAMAESFFSALKNERVYRTVYATKERARRDVIAYIEGFYNSRRRHSALGYRRPNEVHYSNQQPALAA